MTGTRTLPPVPSISEIERSVAALITTAQQIPGMFREALEIAYALESAYNAKGSGGEMANPTQATVLAGVLNSDADDEDPTRWSPERTAIRSAVDALASSLLQAGAAHGRLHSIIRGDERRGMAVGDKSGRDGEQVGKAASQTWTAAAAEKVAAEYDTRAMREGRRPRAVDPRDWRWPLVAEALAG